MQWLALQWLPEPESAASGAREGQGGGPDMPDAQALGWWALQYTPHVTWVDEALMLEVQACERLWGGRRALMRQLAAENPAPVRVRQALGASSLVALARLRLMAAGQRPPSADASQAPLQAALPLWTLTAAQPHLDLLARMGCRSWADVAALPRAGLVRRFGPALREALDIASGQRPEPHVWLSAPEVFDQKLELPALATSAPELLWSAQRLLTTLRLWLQARQRGVLAFELEWTLDLKRLNGVDLPRRQQLLVRTAEPMQDMDHLRRLLAERLALTTLAAPTGWLRLRSVETAPWGGAARSFLPEESRPGEPLHQLLEKLSVRLGAQCVQVPVPQADYRPERMQAWVPAVRACLASASGKAASATTDAGAADPGGGLLPTWLLEPPQELELRDGEPHWHGPLRRRVGPQRVEGDGWWEGPDEAEDEGTDEGVGVAGPIARDYYIAENPQGQLLWIYRERPRMNLDLAAEAGVHAGAAGAAGMMGQAPRWFLHGLYA